MDEQDQRTSPQAQPEWKIKDCVRICLLIDQKTSLRNPKSLKGRMRGEVRNETDKDSRTPERGQSTGIHLTKDWIIPCARDKAHFPSFACLSFLTFLWSGSCWSLLIGSSPYAFLFLFFLPRIGKSGGMLTRGLKRADKTSQASLATATSDQRPLLSLETSIRRPSSVKKKASWGPRDPNPTDPANYDFLLRNLLASNLPFIPSSQGSRKIT